MTGKNHGILLSLHHDAFAPPPGGLGSLGGFPLFGLGLRAPDLELLDDLLHVDDLALGVGEVPQHLPLRLPCTPWAQERLRIGTVVCNTQLVVLY